MVGKRGTRIEKDFLGKIAVPKDAYYGAFTARAAENFQLSGLKTTKEFIKALGMIKKAAALTNRSLDLLNKKESQAIVQAANEVIQGKFDDAFIIDVFQAGAGTPYNMNCNEVIANRATELLKGKKGQYKIHPNNHVNMSQSSNDVVPTAMRLAILFSLPAFLRELEQLEVAFQRKAQQFRKVLKTGRTHLQDAVPITLGQEFHAYADSFKRSRAALQQVSHQLKEVHIGGTAIGTGLNTHPHYRKRMVKQLRKLTQLKLFPTKDPIELTENMDSFVVFSTALKTLAIDIINISRDLILLSSGPRTSIAEIKLPEVEPGSSIMPGKVNPSILEAATMVSYHVISNDHAISYSAMNSVLELNVMTPLILYKVTDSMQLLHQTMIMLRKKCITGITVNKKQTKELLEHSVAFATALNPYLGYDVTAYLVREALRKDLSIRDVLLQHKILSQKELDHILSFEKLVKPGVVDKGIVKQLYANKNYIKILNKVKK